MLSRYTPKLDGSKISNLPIDRVYPIYIHYGKFKGKPTYPDAINSYLRITQFFHAYVLNNSHSPFMWGIVGFKRCELGNDKTRIGKCGGIPSGGKMKSHLSHIGRIEEKCCPYIRKYFL